MWINKPIAMNQGRGISLVRNIEQFQDELVDRFELELSLDKPLMDRIVQRYVSMKH